MTINVSLEQRDKLTDLPIYQAMSELLPVWFHEGVEKTRTARNIREQGGVLVIFCDGDGLKAVNDALGHDRGNEFIRALVERLKTHVPTICGCVVTDEVESCQNHFIARDGGDEFIVIIRDVVNEDAAKGHVITLELLMNEVALKTDDHDTHYLFPVTLSFGGAWSNGWLADGAPDMRRLDDPFRLKEDADTAMRYAKQHRVDGRRQAYFALSMWEAAVQRERLAGLYWRAIRYGDYEIAFMPIVEATVDRRTIRSPFALEALVRPSVPADLADRFSLDPEHMEAFGVTTELLVGVVPRVLDHLLGWRHGYHHELPLVFVNVTPQLLLDERVYREITTLLRDSVYSPVVGRLVFEFTEGSPLPPTKLVHERFADLRRLVKVALDDFGDGHSNIATLVGFEWDIVKLDKEFLLKYSGRKSSRILAAVTRAIVALRPEALILVEGIEDERRHRLVRRLARRGTLPATMLGQGYHYGRAMPEADLFARGLLTARRSAS